MFETLMKSGAYRVDYLNQAASGQPDAGGFYVRGSLAGPFRYSVPAKRHLLGGLDFIRRMVGMNNLVAVYMDVDAANNLARPAYQQLKRDLRAGLFQRIFVYDSRDLIDDPASFEDVLELYLELGGFSLMTCDWMALQMADNLLQQCSSRVDLLVTEGQ